jgi:hypothetical protein
MFSSGELSEYFDLFRFPVHFYPVGSEGRGDGKSIREMKAKGKGTKGFLKEMGLCRPGFFK